MRRSALSLACAIAMSVQCHAQGAGLNPVAPRCEYLDSPRGIDELHPRLSWRVESSQRGQKQSAYQILVASDEKSLKQERGDLWDSGKIASDQTVNIVYGGRPLNSREIC